MKEHDVGIKHKKSALEKFDDKYVIEGKPGVFHYNILKIIISSA